MSRETAEYLPLLPDGLHEMSVADLRALCVESKRFRSSARRNQIMASLDRAVQILSANNIPGEL